jgi:hypothetical protein
MILYFYIAYVCVGITGGIYQMIYEVPSKDNKEEKDVYIEMTELKKI